MSWILWRVIWSTPWVAHRQLELSVACVQVTNLCAEFLKARAAVFRLHRAGFEGDPVRPGTKRDRGRTERARRGSSSTNRSISRRALHMDRQQIRSDRVRCANAAYASIQLSTVSNPDCVRKIRAVG